MTGVDEDEAYFCIRSDVISESIHAYISMLVMPTNIMNSQV